MIFTISLKYNQLFLQKNKTSEWFGNDYNMNLYRGCCHGCIYCDSRSECYHVEDFDTVHAEKLSDSKLKEVMKDNIKELNTQIPAYSQVSDFKIYNEEFEKTPKRSIKRFLYQ